VLTLGRASIVDINISRRASPASRRPIIWISAVQGAECSSPSRRPEARRRWQRDTRNFVERNYGNPLIPIHAQSPGTLFRFSAISHDRMTRRR
jgi:hypothetical protein